MIGVRNIMNNPYDEIQMKPFTLLNDSQIKSVNKKGIQGKSLFIKFSEKNMYDYIDEFYYNLFINHPRLLFDITNYDNGNSYVIDKKMNELFKQQFTNSYSYLVNNNILKFIPKQVLEQTMKHVFSKPRKENKLFKQSI